MSPHGWMMQPSYLDSKRIGDANSSIECQRCPWKECNRFNCKKPWHKPSSFAKYGFVKKLRPVVLWVGVSELLVSVVMAILLVNYAVDIDKLYGKQDNKMISFLSFGGLITLAVSGMVLIVSVMLNKRGIMWFYVLLSTFICIYIFVLSVIMIHFALMVLKKTPVKQKDGQSFLLNKACAIGMLTLLGSVVHFIGTVTVFTYYNLKYIHPVMFNCPAI